ncbi:Piwi domain-containing protein [Hymenobacter psoromatis]|uniref:Piwi domain-containing protein n=1 Tax=Hymenobacter psoromatis TaxID=1484116 RepID=UPI001CBF36B0|nr:Piwi domain-containing protein [Hymenobacter psoromatis]
MEQAEDYKIALNFLRIEQREFSFTIYIVEKILFDFDIDYRKANGIYSYNLPNDDGEYDKYWVSFVGFDKSVPYQCSSASNYSLTNRFIEYKLIERIDSVYGGKNFDTHKGKFGIGVLFYTKFYPEGAECIDIRPYHMSTGNSFGVLINYRFINKTEQSSRKIQQLSLSLDARGFSNKDYYIDNLSKIKGFLNNFFGSILTDLVEGVSFSNKLTTFDAELLNERVYLIGDDVKVLNPFLGLKQKQAKPLKMVSDEVTFYFLYEQGEGEYAKSVLEGLKGSAFPNVFSGIEDFFGIPVGKNFKASYLHDWSAEGILNKIEEIRASASGKIITIGILPSKEHPDNNRKYYLLKYYFTNEKMPLQLITKPVISNGKTFEYSIANIALQIFCKLGGYPWKIEPSNDNCLIVGLGQSYRYETKENQRVIKKTLAYSVLTDSSGIFKSIKILANNTDERYLSELERNLLSILGESMASFTKIAIHTPFRLNRETMDKLSAKCSIRGIELVIIVINEKNDFFGYHTKGNTLIPYESSYVKISGGEYLIWFEGLKKGSPKASKRVPGPISISFLHSNINDFNEEHRQLYLQDCINLSGANWKGFKAKNVPVSMYYCQEIAEFLKHFEEYNLDKVSFDNDFPWFL